MQEGQFTHKMLISLITFHQHVVLAQFMFFGIWNHHGRLAVKTTYTVTLAEFQIKKYSLFCINPSVHKSMYLYTFVTFVLQNFGEL